jgi:hypothetical protein
VLARLVAAEFAGSSRLTGWDPSPADRGPWRLQMLTVDPERAQRQQIGNHCQKPG